MQDLAPEAKEIINLLTIWQNTHSSWIESREIAIWAALVLFISICGAYYKYGFSDNRLPKNNMNFGKVIVYCLPVILLLILFSQFIFIQFGTKNDTLSWQATFTRTVFLLINKQLDPTEFHISDTIEDFFPEKIQKFRQDKLKEYRKKSILTRWLMPFFMFCKSERESLSNSEKEEGIIYSMMLATALLTMVFSIIPAKTEVGKVGTRLSKG
jgi:hypothetical protein